MLIWAETYMLFPRTINLIAILRRKGSFKLAERSIKAPLKARMAILSLDLSG